MGVWMGAGWPCLVLLFLGRGLAQKLDMCCCPTVSSLIVSPESTRVPITCPSRTISLPKDEVHYYLYLNQSHIHTAKFHQVSDGSGGLIKFFKGDGNRSREFEVTANQTGIYICLEDKRSPPAAKDCRMSIVVHQEKLNVPEAILSPPPTNGSGSEDSMSVLQLVPLIGSSILLVYSLVVTSVIICMRMTMKTQEEPQSEYMNTKPGEFTQWHKAKARAFAGTPT